VKIKHLKSLCQNQSRSRHSVDKTKLAAAEIVIFPGQQALQPNPFDPLIP